jgi:hypothetical protein
LREDDSVVLRLHEHDDDAGDELLHDDEWDGGVLLRVLIAAAWTKLVGYWDMWLSIAMDFCQRVLARRASGSLHSGAAAMIFAGRRDFGMWWIGSFFIFRASVGESRRPLPSRRPRCVVVADSLVSAYSGGVDFRFWKLNLRLGAWREDHAATVGSAWRDMAAF